MHLPFILVTFIAFTIAAPSKLNAHSRKAIIAKTEDDLMNEQIFYNNIEKAKEMTIIVKLLQPTITKNPIHMPIRRKTFPSYVNSLNNNTYLPILKSALVYANAMYEGLFIETQEWATNKEVVNLAVKDNIDLFNRGKFESLGHEVCRNFRKHALNDRTRWYLYTVALQNLIKFKRPHSEFFELVTNIFKDVRYHDAEFDSYVDLYERTHESLIDYDSEIDSDDEEDEILENEQIVRMMKLNRKFQEIRDDEKTSVAYKTKWLNILTNLMDENVSRFEEYLSLMNFFEFFRPLISKNNFLNVLNASKQFPEPSIPLGGELTTSVLTRVISNYEIATKSDFAIDNIRTYFVPHFRFGTETEIGDLTVSHISSIFHHAILDLLEIFEVSISKNMDTMIPLFRHNAIEFKARLPAFPTLEPEELKEFMSVYKLGNILPGDQPIGVPFVFGKQQQHPRFQWVSKLHDMKVHTMKTPSIIVMALKRPLSFLYIEIFKLIMSAETSLDEALNLRWPEVGRMIVGLGGHFKTTGKGSQLIKIPRVKDSIPTRFDSPHGKKLGASVFVLKSIFQGWGLHVNSFKG